ncbi:DUF3541 domain-containing protein [Thalassotalea maritima]|uniref:DUF3541 domain-containing protein n=1 Tax=Thalassotalea maritima TaxID=3242416 RepID=UPI0035287B5E
MPKSTLTIKANVVNNTCRQIRMFVILLSCCCLLLSCHSNQTLLTVDAKLPANSIHQAATKSVSYQQVATRIQHTFEQHLYQLPPRIQGHYAIRLYRLTGDKKYLSAALYDYYVVNDRLHAIVSNLDKPNYITDKSAQLISQLSLGKRGKARRLALKPFPEFIFYADALLRYAARLNEFGIDVPEAVRNALASYDFLPALTNQAMIHAWAAQLANYVYWLDQLGIVDHRQRYQQAFIAAYPDHNDHALSRWQFHNKLYGLTHFIFAASRYYQQHLELSKFSWVLNYFTRNQQRIVEQASADIIAEVGLSYLLLKQHQHPMVSISKDSLIQAFDPTVGLIPSVSGKAELASAEHRNVLALMLLSWPQTLHQGPHFEQLPSIDGLLPEHVFNNTNRGNGER